MPERTVTVASRSGLHARPAAMFVKAATAQPVPVKVRVGDGRPADARSILAILALRVEHGTTVTLRADGDAADQALDTLADLLSRDLDADDAKAAPAASVDTSAAATAGVPAPATVPAAVPTTGTNPVDSDG
jgi:phosphocarrier protein